MKNNKILKVSYSQNGEDIIVNNLAKMLNIKEMRYLDIGAHDPIELSNTYLFYSKQNYGVCIEPNPAFLYRYKKFRRKDKILNVGIGISEKADNAKYYMMSTSVLNTFSKEMAHRYENYGAKIVQTVSKPLVMVDTIIKEHFDYCPNFISIDVEGLDYEILRSINFEIYRPEIICLETVEYDKNNNWVKNAEKAIHFMSHVNYTAFADTYYNTIFVDMIKLKKRK